MLLSSMLDCHQQDFVCIINKWCHTVDALDVHLMQEEENSQLQAAEHINSNRNEDFSPLLTISHISKHIPFIAWRLSSGY